MMAGVGEMLASALVGEVVSKLSSSLWNEIGLLYNFRTDLEDIKGTLTQLIAFLEDAERQSRRGPGGSMSKWLERLKSATKDIGDLISNYEARIPVNGEKNSDKLKLIISNFFSEFNTLLIAHKIKGMRKKLNNIAAEKAYFTDVVGFDEQQEINNRATTSDLETIIVGREKEKEKLVHLLLDAKEEGDFGIIAIVGFGGLGKTTLAQLVFNDKRVNEPAFHLKAWVYVSMKFDFKKIVENLIESIKNSRGNPGTYNTEEDACKELQGLLQGKKFLIVLDDLWEENWKNLDKLKRVLRGGMKSSKVILTTRTGIIAISMGARPHFIEFLSDENCWRLFSQKAFKSDVERGNKELVEIGKQIVQKCKGVPLAAQALGAIMPFKDGVDAWKSVRDSDLWELEEESELLSKLEILPSLKLSYYNMPSCLKLCFAYCSIFPKGSQIKKANLIKQWIALGLIPENKRNIKLEELGREYINHLVWMCFLQADASGREEYSQMHDMVHDLATSIARDEILICDGNQNNKSTAFTQYFQVVNSGDTLIRCKDLPKKLKALHFENCRSPKLDDRIFSKAKFLRVLSLLSCEMNTLPTSIGQLQRLIYLNCYNLPVITLPNSLCQLKSLKGLYIMRCNSLVTLPDSIGDLATLEEFEIVNCFRLGPLPQSMFNLANLNTLYIIGCMRVEYGCYGSKDWKKYTQKIARFRIGNMRSKESS